MKDANLIRMMSKITLGRAAGRGEAMTAALSIAKGARGKDFAVVERGGAR
jgi:hypothetical protein